MECSQQHSSLTCPAVTKKNHAIVQTSSVQSELIVSDVVRFAWSEHNAAFYSLLWCQLTDKCLVDGKGYQYIGTCSFPSGYIPYLFRRVLRPHQHVSPGPSKAKFLFFCAGLWRSYKSGVVVPNSITHFILQACKHRPHQHQQNHRHQPPFCLLHNLAQVVVPNKVLPERGSWMLSKLETSQQCQLRPDILQTKYVHLLTAFLFVYPLLYTNLPAYPNACRPGSPTCSSVGMEITAALPRVRYPTIVYNTQLDQ